MLQDNKYTLNSLDNALSILHLFMIYPELGISDLSSISGINKSSIFRTLATLEHRGFLVRGTNKKYKLGLKFFTLGQLVYHRNELVSAIHPYLEFLSEETTESSYLAAMGDATHIVFLDSVISSSWLKTNVPLGLRPHAHLTGAGKAILAFETEQKITRYMEQAEFFPQTKYSIQNPAEAIKILQAVRKNGYASNSEEYEIGLTSFAVPIFDALGNPIVSISCSGASTRMEHNKEKILSFLCQTAKEIHSAIL